MVHREVDDAMTLRRRIVQLERQFRHPAGQLGEWSDTELDARNLAFAAALEQIGGLEPDMRARLDALDLREASA
jgi:hypothetical protein